MNKFNPSAKCFVSAHLKAHTCERFVPTVSGKPSSNHAYGVSTLRENGAVFQNCRVTDLHLCGPFPLNFLKK